MMEPKIRFSSNNILYEEKTLSEISTINPKTNVPLEFEYVDLESVSGTEMTNHRTEHKATAPSRAQRLAKKGDIFYQTVRPYQRNNYYFDMDDDNYVFSTGYAQIRPSIYGKYLFTLLQNDSFLKQVLDNCAGTSFPAINPSVLSRLSVRICTDKQEQQAIASYFTSLDSQISAATSRLASLKQMKAASLQAMFPQEGETVPKIRFKGFEGEWKKVMFSETFEFLKNNSLSRAELSNEGDIVNVHYGDVLIKYGDLLNIQNEELTFIADNKIGNTLYNSCHLQNGDIIIADAAEDNTVGKCSEIVNICNKRVVSGLHTIPCRPLNRFAQGYLGHYINSESYHNQLLPLIQGSKISSISKKTLSQTIVLVPSIEEQKCIGNYFTSLDRQISLQSQRLEKLKQIKSACLDKMFV